ncbi:hypothetical protein NQ318_004753 [Aromia moschata]|uniref:Cathepsin propeptide inhibitor domain-containing protein n=1 Tax=Aromia moschata TaxID=1265417 RepID=A0AAV8XXT0_9CUCU|nr:hypothetical protein NQ318_004753 [Aromia moschata]
MKMCTIFVLALVAAVSASEQEYWTQFKTKYGKMYRSSLEEVKRHSIFLDNLKKIEEHNEKYKIGNSSYEMGINEFADVTTEEFLEKLNYAKRSKPVVQASKDYFVYDANEDLPQTIDWGERGPLPE